MTAAISCLLATTAFSQTFSIDLDEVGTLYDEIFAERAVWDTVGTIDVTTITLGEYYKHPHFLKSDFKKTRTLVEYRAIDGYKVTFTYPPVYSFDFRETPEGEYYYYQPRDLSIPGLAIELEKLDLLVERVRVRSARETWREAVRTSVTRQRIVARGGKGSINVQIPLPMPRQLESIFGPGEKTHINISGREEITFAGESRRVSPFLGVEGRQNQSLFPSLDMKQQLDVTLTGSIGDKVNIKVDHSSQAMTENANKIELNYVGYEDDVIKRIDLGNTSLSLPGSQMISFSSTSKGLFGVKVLAQIGATELTVIASKQEGEVSNASFSPHGGAIGQTEERKIADYNYIANQYFWFNHPSFNDSTLWPDTGKEIIVYQSVTEAEKSNTEIIWIPGKAFVDRYGDGADIDNAMAIIKAKTGKPNSINQGFQELTVVEDYEWITFLDDTKKILGIVLNRPVPSDKALAVMYTNRKGEKIGGSYSDYGISVDLAGGERDTLALELIKPTSNYHFPTGNFGWVWHYMMRNFYNLGVSNIDPGSLELTIEDILVPRLDASAPSGSKIPYIRIFGLDQYNKVGEPGFDNIVDFKEGALDLNTGILQFPSLRPFQPGIAEVIEWTDSLFDFTGYEAQYDSARFLYDNILTYPEDYHQYDIVVRAVSTSRSFKIDAFNIVENSERVTLDGRTLSNGTDYDINYDTGEIELKGDALESLSPDSRINIDYEYKPFGGGAASSLVGFSTLSSFGQNGRFGSTWLYESKSTAAEKPRLGEEPTRAVVGGFNANFSRQVELLTGLVNKLPLVDTDATSTVTLGGEFAASFPDPNTKGEAYIDDFEGAEDSDRISSNRRAWMWASPPAVAVDSVTYATVPADSQWGFIWYNIEPDYGVHRKDLNPDLHDRENTLVSSLDIEIDPYPSDSVWVGLMTGFGGGGLDLSKGQFIEIWINDFKPDPATRGGKMFIDMGSIDEDFYEPGRNQWNDEDGNGDGWIANTEDTGLDGVYNNEECGSPPCGETDRAGDDYDFRRIDGKYSKINGTERNQFRDNEDLDGSNSLDELNSYFTFVIDLGDTAVIDVREEYGSTHPIFNNEVHKRDSWRLYRIDLNQGVPVAPDGVTPRLDQVKHIRVWFDNVAESFQTQGAELVRRFQFADFKVVGNRWEENGVRDLNDTLVPADSAVATTFGIGVISTKTDPVRYHPPIRPREQNEIFEKEQSLFIEFDSLEAQTSIRILKRFAGSGLNLTNYRDLNFWVHADPKIFNGDLEYYFRMGTNENYYYEVTVPLTSKYFDKVTGWARVMIDLVDLTSLKLAPVDSLGKARGYAADVAQLSRSYPVSMKNSPNLGDVRFLYAGVRNTSTTGQVFSGQIWLDDIYVGDVRRDFGYAERLTASVNLGGGIINLSGSWSRTDADFRALRARRGSGTLNQSYALNARTSIQHFVPLLGFAIPVTFGYNKSESRPKYVPNSDVEIENKSVADSLRTERVTRSFSTSLSRRSSKNPLLKYTIGKMTTNFSVSETVNRSPALRDTTRAMGGQLGYNISWTSPRDIRLYKNYKFRYWINSMNFNVSASRRTSRRARFLNGEFVKDPFNFDAKLNASGAVNYSPVRSLSSAFNMAMARDVNLPHEVFGVDIGTEVSRNHGLKVTYKPPPLPVLKWFSPDGQFNSAYRENSSANVRRLGDPKGTRKVDNSRVTTLKLKLDVGKHLGTLFDKVGLHEQKTPAGPNTGRQAGTAAGVRTNVPQPAGADTTAVDTLVAGPRASRADPMIAVRKLGSVLREIRRVDVNIRQTVASSYARIPVRPSLAYQLALKMDAGAAAKDGPVGGPDRTNKNFNISLRSGAQISKNIDLQGQYTTTLTNTETEAGETEARSVSWPDFSLSWKGLEEIGFFRSVFTMATANLNYKKFMQESGRKDEMDNKRETLAITPSLVFTWKNDMNTTVTMSYSKNENETRGNKSETSSSSLNINFKKELKGGTGFKLPIPFFRKEVRWKSRLDTGLAITYMRTGGKRYVTGSEFFTPIPSTNSFGVSPNLMYGFSDKLNGRLFIDYSRGYNEASDQTTTAVRVGVSAVFTF